MVPSQKQLSLQVVGPLLHERDLYLAWSLKRSKAVNGRYTCTDSSITIVTITRINVLFGTRLA